MADTQRKRAGSLILPIDKSAQERQRMETQAKESWQQHIVEHGVDPLTMKLMRADPRLKIERAKEYEDAIQRKHDTERIRAVNIARREASESMARDRIKADFDRHTRISFHGDESMEGWSGGDQEIAGAHHKFPKRTLGWLHSRMTDDQRRETNKELMLPLDSGPKGWSRLRSNLISSHNKKVSPDLRSDDPEHTHEWMDVVHDQSGAMTPRSREYSSLADHYEQIHQRLEGIAATQKMDKDQARGLRMTDAEARGVASRMRRAELFHDAIEPAPSRPSHSEPGFWRENPSSERPYSKSRVDGSRFENLAVNEPRWTARRKHEMAEDRERYQKMKAEQGERHSGLLKSESLGASLMRPEPHRPMGGRRWAVHQGRTQAEVDLLSRTDVAGNGRTGARRWTQAEVTDARQLAPLAEHAYRQHRDLAEAAYRQGVPNAHAVGRAAYEIRLNALANITQRVQNSPRVRWQRAIKAVIAQNKAKKE